MRALPAIVLLVMSCADPIDAANEDLLTEPDERERRDIIRALDAHGDPGRLMALLEEVLQRENDGFPVFAALRKLQEIDDPAFVPARDAMLLRWIRQFHSPWFRDGAIEALSRPDVDVHALAEAFAWCVREYPDPGKACLGFIQKTSGMGENAARMFAEAAREGDRIVAYYAARFACLRSFTTQAAREAVRDALIAAQSHGHFNGHLAACIAELAKTIPVTGLDPTPRPPCTTVDIPRPGG